MVGNSEGGERARERGLYSIEVTLDYSGAETAERGGAAT
jgi:hypothetical protein